MANEENLIPLKDRTPKEQRDFHSKGGIASGKARREKADIRRQVERAMTMIYSNGKTGEEILTDSVVAKGIESGDIKYLVEIAKILGQYDSKTEETENPPTLKIEIVDNEKIIKGEENE